MLDQGALQVILMRAEAASPGPWARDGLHVWTMDEDCIGGGIADCHDETPRGGNRPEQNMEFIAHARKDVPDLVGEILAARAAHDWAKIYIAELEKAVDPWVSAVERQPAVDWPHSDHETYNYRISEPVIVLDKWGDVYRAMWTVGPDWKTWSLYSHWQELPDVTHWRSLLPAPPQVLPTEALR